MTDPAITFYQSLAGISFTLLGLWFAVLQFSHGGWRTDAERHRSGLHIALHFFLPGLASLVALLAAGLPGGLLWRIAFAIGGVVGLLESLSFLRASNGPRALAGRTLRALDPVLYLFMIAATFVPPETFPLTPLQIEGTATGSLFVVGLCFVWLAFAETEDPAGSAAGATLVLVHGGWHGGWCWRRVAGALREAGHEVHTPTLTGLGDRAHLRGPLGDRVGLHTHVGDIAALILAEDLHDVVLVGHSYAGLVIEGAADRVPDRVGRLVHLDSFVPVAGKSLFDLLPPERREFYERRVRDGVVDPPPVEELGITDPETARRVAARLTPQPLRTFTDSLPLAGTAQGVPRSYVRCTEGPLVPSFAPFAAMARSDPAWEVHEFASGHDAMVAAPDELAGLLGTVAVR